MTIANAIRNPTPMVYYEGCAEGILARVPVLLSSFIRTNLHEDGNGDLLARVGPLGGAYGQKGFVPLTLGTTTIEPSSISRRIIKGGTENSRGVRSKGRL